MLYILLALVAVFVGVVLFRALAFTPPKKHPYTAPAPQFDRARSAQSLARLIQCRTVSHQDPALEDEGEFQKFIGLLPRLYPHVFAACRFTQLPHRGLLLHWKGREAGDPAVLMAHYDVVPAQDSGWDKPPFSGVIEEGVLWGRGTLDTKGTLHSALYAADTLISQGFIPQKDVYFAFSGGEEVNGLGAETIVSWFEEGAITPALVLDEGGAVVEGVFPGVKRPCALVGIGEKGMLNARFVAKSAGGHASAPIPNAPVDRLSRAACRVLKKPFAMHLSVPAARMFDTLGRHSTFLYRLIFANLWCFAPVLDLLGRLQGGEMNALLRTTLAFTQMKGAPAPNVIPPQAELVANLRLNPADSVDSALARLQKLAGKDVEVTAMGAFEPSRVSATDTEGWQKLSAAISQTWPEAIVSPYLMIQCADARHWGRISHKVYRFSAMDLSAAERRTIHGHNERVRLDCLHRAVEFYLRLIQTL